MTFTSKQFILVDMIKLTDELFEKIANTDEHKMVLIQKVVNEYLPDVKFSVDDNGDDIIV